MRDRVHQAGAAAGSTSDLTLKVENGGVQDAWGDWDREMAAEGVEYPVVFPRNFYAFEAHTR